MKTSQQEEEIFIIQLLFFLFILYSANENSSKLIQHEKKVNFLIRKFSTVWKISRKERKMIWKFRAVWGKSREENFLDSKIPSIVSNMMDVFSPSSCNFKFMLNLWKVFTIFKRTLWDHIWKLFYNQTRAFNKYLDVSI